jgi:hypothetical protein
MYNAEYFFVDNPLNRYTLSARNDLKKNADGSVSTAHGRSQPYKKRTEWAYAVLLSSIRRCRKASRSVWRQSRNRSKLPCRLASLRCPKGTGAK